MESDSLDGVNGWRLTLEEPEYCPYSFLVRFPKGSVFSELSLVLI